MARGGGGGGVDCQKAGLLRERYLVPCCFLVMSSRHLPDTERLSCLSDFNILQMLPLELDEQGGQTSLFYNIILYSGIVLNSFSKALTGIQLCEEDRISYYGSPYIKWLTCLSS